MVGRALGRSLTELLACSLRQSSSLGGMTVLGWALEYVLFRATGLICTVSQAVPSLMHSRFSCDRVGSRILQAIIIVLHKNTSEVVAISSMDGRRWARESAAETTWVPRLKFRSRTTQPLTCSSGGITLSPSLASPCCLCDKSHSSTAVQYVPHRLITHQVRYSLVATAAWRSRA